MGLDMSIVKFEVNFPELKKAVEKFTENRVKAFESMLSDIKDGAATLINQLLNAEMGVYLGEPEQSDNKRNGYSTKEYALKGVGTLKIKIPIDRKRNFESKIIPKHERMDPRLSDDLAALHLAGLSTRTLSMMANRILGIDISHTHVSNCIPKIAEQANIWLSRPIVGKYWCLIIDGTNFNIRRRGSVEKEPSLVVLGIDKNNFKSILAIEPGNRDDAKSWRQLFKDLKQRGLIASDVTLGIMDGLSGLETVFKEEFPESVTARCWFHSLQNALAKAPKRLQDPFYILAKKVMYAQGYDDAKEKFTELKKAMNTDCAKAVNCLEKDLESLIVHFKFNKKLWRALKTTNSVERIHKEFKRRAKAMESLGEVTLRALVAFTALRLENGWKKRAVDTYDYDSLPSGRKKLEEILDFSDEKVIN